MEIKDMNIFERMLNITNEIANVNKNLTVGEGKGKYKAVGEADVLKAVKELEFKYRVYSYPVNREILESSMFTTTNSYGDEKNNIFSRIKTTYRFVNIDKADDYIETVTFAEGIDSQDKGSGKAMTYSDKYALMKSYKIITGEDPDQDPSEPEKKTTKKEETKSNKITEVEAKSIYALMVRKGYDVIPTLQEFFKVNNTKDLNRQQFMEILNHCNTLPDVPKKEE